MMGRTLGLVMVGAVLAACAAKAVPDESGTTTEADSFPDECNTGGDACCAINSNFCDPGDEDTTFAASTTIDPDPDPEPTTTTFHPDDADDDWNDDWNDDDSCNTGGDDCCEVNSNFCTARDFEPDINGNFLMAFALPSDPTLPLQYHVTVEVTWYDGYEAGIDFVLYPLSLDIGSTTVPREPVGPAIVVSDVIVNDDDLAFEISLEALLAAAETNPISGTELEMTVVFSGTVLGANGMCGTASGEIVAPLVGPLDGATFAMLRVPNVNSLPANFPVACP